MAAQLNDGQLQAILADHAEAAAAPWQPPVSPRVAQAWTEAIVQYWEEQHACGALDLDAPLCVIDLGSPEGILAQALPAALATRMPGSRIHYVACAGEALLLDASLTANPMVLVGWHSLAGSPCARYAVHYGELFTAADDAWVKGSAPCPEDNLLLAFYAQRCASAAVDLPAAALALQRHFAAMAHGQYLLIGVDCGPSALSQMRLQSCADGLPNLHAVLLAHSSHGASTWRLQHDDHGGALYLARGDGADPAALSAILANAHPDDALAMTALARCAEPAQAVVLLRSSGHDPAVLAACIDTVLAASSTALGPQWQPILERVWANYRLPEQPDDFHRQLAHLAARARHWGLAKACLHAGLAAYGYDRETAALLARCEAACGHRVSSDTTLALVPLRHCHARALQRQYRDPDIAAMACLPPLESPGAAARWISAQRKTPGKLSYAVMHAHWGLVGVVGLHRSADTAYFYFWTGCDFQDQGFGRAAATLAWVRARALAIGHVYTSVYVDNMRSRRALDALGFTVLPVRAMPPHADLMFLHLALDGAAAAPDRLASLCAAIGNPIQFQQEQEAYTMTAQT